jgi:hypothetical protein
MFAPGKADRLLDVERGLARPGTAAGAAIHRDVRDRCMGSVAGLECGDVRRIVGLELVQDDRLSGALIAGGVQPRKPVGGGDLVGGETALGRLRGLGGGARLWTAGRDVGGGVRPGARDGRALDQRPRVGQRVQADHALDDARDVRVQKWSDAVGDRSASTGQGDTSQRQRERALQATGRRADRN